MRVRCRSRGEAPSSRQTSREQVKSADWWTSRVRHDRCADERVVASRRCAAPLRWRQQAGRRRGAGVALHVVVATRIFAPEPAAASLRLSALVDALAEAGHRVTVLTTTTPDRGVYRPPAGVVVKRWPVLRDRDGYVRGYLQYLSFDVPLALRLLGVRGPDVVVVEPPPTTGLVAAVVTWLRRTPFVYYAADVWSDAVVSAGMSGVVAKVLRVLERRVLRAARVVLATSAGVAKRVRALGAEATEVGNGVDTTVFTPVGSAVDCSRPYLIYTGTASEVHGADVFTRAMAQVHASRPDARLVVIGQGSDLPEMRRQVAGLPPDTVTFLPRMAPEEVAEWIRGAQAALASVLPGPYAFAFPSKVYAAAACGTPVVFAGVGDRKSTRLNSSHVAISYAVFCLKKKK